MVLEAANILHVRTIKYSFFCHRYVSLWSYRNATFCCCHLDATIENAMCIARRTTTPPRVAQQTIRWDRIDSGAQIKHQLQISQHFHFAHPQITVDGKYICTRNTLAENKHRVRTAYCVHIAKREEIRYHCSIRMVFGCGIRTMTHVGIVALGMTECEYVYTTSFLSSTSSSVAEC